MSNILFGVAVAILIASLAGAVWSVAVPGRRIWPPPGHRSWQYLLTWAGFYAVCGINLLLLLTHWNSWVFQSPLRFVVGIPLALLGGMLTAYGATKRPRLVWLLAGRPLMAPCREPHPSPVSGGRRAAPLSHRQMRILSVGLVGWPRTDVWSAASGGAETSSQFRDGRRRAPFSTTLSD